MLGENNSDSSTSESDVSACSSNFKPLKALYSNKVKVPVKSAPLYENIVQFEAAQNKKHEIIPFGKTELVAKRKEEKERKTAEEEALLAAKNKQRFAQYEGMIVRPKEHKTRNVLTRMEVMDGPLKQLMVWVDKSLRLKIITRKDKGLRGELHATVVAFDKQWNLALSDVDEIWIKKTKQEKVIPGSGTPVPKGTAATISPVPIVDKTHLGKGVWECSRHIPQLMVRGEHVVVIHLLVP